MDEILTATVKVPIRTGWDNDQCQFFARFHRFRKWWKFWEDRYEDLPLDIISLDNNKCQK